MSMNDDFNKNEDEVVDSIPKSAKNIDNREEPVHNQNNYGGYYKKTRVIIEEGPPSTMVKIGFMLSLGSIVFCCFPLWSFIFAFLGAGISLLAIGFKQNGRGPAIVAIVISIIGCVLASISGLWLMAWTAIINLFY